MSFINQQNSLWKRRKWKIHFPGHIDETKWKEHQTQGLQKDTIKEKAFMGQGNQLATSTSSRSSISGLTTKRLTSTLNDMLYYFKHCRYYMSIFLL
jgi:phage replication-related protein YjqB (UPF0714/DUF867 family)